MSQRYGPEHSSRICLDSDQHEMHSSNSDVGFDKQGSQNYEELFDSGYNSNLQSKTFLDLEGELESSQEQKSLEMASLDKKLASTSASQQWSDSGVCITDSGLGINEDDNFESQSKNVPEDKESPIKESSTYKIWDKQNSEGDTLLHLAIIEDLEDVACSIIQNASSSPEMLNSYNYLYQTPLHLAVLKRQMNVIQHLISRQVSLTFQDNLGNTPLHIACKYSLTDIVQYFLITSHKKLLSSNFFQMRNYEGDTCIHLAAYNTNYRILEMLIRSGAKVDVQEGKSGKTVLHWAVENLNVQLVYFLLKKCNASVHECTFSDKTPLYMAWKINNSLKYDTSNILKSKTSKIINLLLEYYDEPKLTLENLINGPESELSSDEE